MKVILESMMRYCVREPVIVPVASYAEARKIADAMANAIMTFWDSDDWTYEWTDDRRAFVHHCAFYDEDHCDITIIGDAATAAAEKRERVEA